MLWKVLLCALLTGLLLLLCGAALHALFLPLRGEGLKLVLFARGRGEALEQSCRSYRLLRRTGALDCPLVLLDRGLDEEGRALAERLTGEGIVLVGQDEAGGTAAGGGIVPLRGHDPALRGARDTL